MKGSPILTRKYIYMYKERKKERKKNVPTCLLEAKWRDWWRSRSRDECCDIWACFLRLFSFKRFMKTYTPTASAPKMVSAPTANPTTNTINHRNSTIIFNKFGCPLLLPLPLPLLDQQFFWKKENLFWMR